MSNANSKFGEWQKVSLDILEMFEELRRVLPVGTAGYNPDRYRTDGAGLYQFRFPSSAQAITPQGSTLRAYTIVEGKFDNGHLVPGTANVPEE